MRWQPILNLPQMISLGRPMRFGKSNQLVVAAQRATATMPL